VIVIRRPNKSQTHPCDGQRWFAFLICLYDRPTDDHQADVVKECYSRTAGQKTEPPRLFLSWSSGEVFCEVTIIYASEDNQAEIVLSVDLCFVPEKLLMRRARSTNKP